MSAGPDPVVPRFPAGKAPLPSDFNTWIQAPFTFLTTKVMFRAQYEGTLSLTGDAFTKIPYDTILEDPYDGWDATNHTWMAPTGCTGWYEVTMTAFADEFGTDHDTIQAVLYLDGALYAQPSGIWGAEGHSTGCCAQVDLPMTGGFDYISGYIFVSTTVDTTGETGQYPTIEVVWISL